jgi:hypothetical protein
MSFNMANNIYFFTKQATLMRRSTVLSLPLQLVFPGQIYGRISSSFSKRRHDTQLNNSQHIVFFIFFTLSLFWVLHFLNCYAECNYTQCHDTQLNDSQHIVLFCDAQHYAEYQTLLIAVLNAIILSVTCWIALC